MLPATGASAMNTKGAHPGDGQGWLWFAPSGGLHLARCTDSNTLPEIGNATARPAVDVEIPLIKINLLRRGLRG